MFTRKTIFALATFAALGAAALAPNSASAWGHGGGGRGGGHGGWGHHGGGGGWGHRWGGGWGHRFGWGYGGGWRNPDRCWPGLRWCRGPLPVYGGGGGYPGAVAGNSGQPAGPDSNPSPPHQECLAKGYLPDGSVVFTDRCTHEGAVAQHGDEPPPDAPRGVPGS